MEPGRSREDSAEFKSRLRKELVSRDGHKELAKNTKYFSLCFVDPQKEKLYHRHIESSSSFVLMMFIVIRLALAICVGIALPK